MSYFSYVFLLFPPAAAAPAPSPAIASVQNGIFKRQSPKILAAAAAALLLLVWAKNSLM